MLHPAARTDVASATEFVAQVAIRGGFSFFMAIHAGCHRNLFLLPEHVAAMYFAVTGRTIGFDFQMILMAEEHKAGQFINALPGNFPLGFFIRQQYLERRACGWEFAMTR